MNNSLISLEKIDAFVFDFDGVLTNNLVHLDQSGRELVSCSRADGLAFDVLHKINKPVYILSTEKNKVVEARAKKLKTPVFQGISNKVIILQELVESNAFDIDNVFYVGNDLNDFNAMKICGYAACPIDSHPKIKEISDYVLNVRGGEGVIRELVENIFKIDIMRVLYS